MRYSKRCKEVNRKCFVRRQDKTRWGQTFNTVGGLNEANQRTGAGIVGQSTASGMKPPGICCRFEIEKLLSGRYDFRVLCTFKQQSFKKSCAF